MSKPARYLCRFILVAAFALEVAACDIYADDPGLVFLNFFILVYAGLALGGVAVIDGVVRWLRRSDATAAVAALHEPAVVVYDMPDNQRVYRALTLRSPQDAEELAASSGISGHRLEEAVSWLVDEGVAECVRASGSDYSFSTVRLTA
jgi:hypothetical protein